MHRYISALQADSKLKISNLFHDAYARQINRKHYFACFMTFSLFFLNGISHLRALNSIVSIMSE